MVVLSPMELMQIYSIDTARARANLSEFIWTAVDMWLGGLGGNLRVFGLLSDVVIMQAITEVRVPTFIGDAVRPLEESEAMQMTLMYRIARQKAGLPDIEESQLAVVKETTLAMKSPGEQAKASKWLAPVRERPTMRRKPKAQPWGEGRSVQELQLAVENAMEGEMVVKGLSYFHGADNLRSMLHHGLDCATEISKSRWDHSPYYDPTAGPGSFAVYTKHGVFVDLPEAVDYAFFNMDVPTANRMDPMQRSCLKQGYRAFVNAKMSRHSLQGSRTGVYSGSMNYDYLMEVTGILDRGTQANLSNRISHVLGMCGPSIFVDTGCSSSLVAADLAATHVRKGRISNGLALGVNHLMSPIMYINRCLGRLLSTVGRSAAFDSRSDGYVVGEGCGAIVIGWSSKATDSTGVWRASQIMQDGRSAQLTAPSGPAQHELLRDTLRRANVHPSEIDASECQCNGSHMGDPIELGALEKVHRPAPRENPLLLLSGKTNKGHAEGNAGMTGIIKSILLLEDRSVPPIIHFKNLNPHIDVEGLPWLFPSEGLYLPRSEVTTLSGSSFGFGGVNGHFIMVARKRRRAVGVEDALEWLPPTALPSASSGVEDAAPQVAAARAAPAAESVAAAPETPAMSLEEIQQLVISVAKNVIESDTEPGLDTSLMESGVDSLSAISFRNDLQRHSGLSLKGTLMFDYPTMGEIANHMLEVAEGGG